MLLVALFEDHPEKLAVRHEQMAAHLEFLRRHSDVIRVAGSLRDAPEVAALGGLWIIEADDTGTATDLIHSDPFWKSGLRKSYRLLHWSKAFEDQVVAI